MERENSSFFENSNAVKELSPKDFESVATWKLTSKKCTAVLFFAPWCPHCVSFKDTWEKLGKVALFMDIRAMNCEKYNSHMAKIKEDMPELVKSFPTIVFYKNGQPIEHYADERTHEKLLKACMDMCQKEHSSQRHGRDTGGKSKSGSKSSNRR